MPVPVNDLTCYKGEDFTPSFVIGTPIVSSTAANPSVITCSQNHNLISGLSVWITEHVSTPTLSGPYTVTVLSPTTFSIPVNVTVGGSGGYVSALTSSIAGWTIVAYIKALDSQASPDVTENGVITDGPNRRFKIPFTSAHMTSLAVGTSYKYDIWRIDSGFFWVLSTGAFTVLAERKFQTP